uniref:peptidyl-tRNA hydrolase n=1 Tax=Naja naja TaxID=35670 RepID=A0A8C6V6D0_NAJNA
MAAVARRSLVQYVVLRGDLLREPFSWPLGASVAQACHAALAVVYAYYEHPDTADYLAQDGSMRTVVLERMSMHHSTILRHIIQSICMDWIFVAPDECALSTLAERLQQNGIDHKVWIEQPENIATCIALRPYQKEHVHHHLKNFKLLK